MRFVVGLGLLGLAIYGFKKWQEDVREGEKNAAWREKTAAALLEGLALL